MADKRTEKWKKEEERHSSRDLLRALMGRSPVRPEKRQFFLQVLERMDPAMIREVQEKNTDRKNRILNIAVGMDTDDAGDEINNPINQHLAEEQMYHMGVPMGFEDDYALNYPGLLGLALNQKGARTIWIPGNPRAGAIGHEAGHLAIPEHNRGESAELYQRQLDSVTNPKGSFMRPRADANIGAYATDPLRSQTRAAVGQRLKAAGVPPEVILEGLFRSGRVD